MLLHTTTEAGYPAVYINGGSIAARSIYSAQIQANAIVAEHLRAGQISSDHISTAGITADNIKGKTLSSSVPVSSGGSFINLDTGNINFAGGNLTWDNTTKTFYINASTLQIGGKNVLNTDTDLAQQINNKGTTRIQGNKLHFTNQVLMDDAFIELLTANNIFAQRIDARDINANRITSGTLAADFIQGGTFNGQSMIVKNITADAIKGGTFDGQSMTIRNLTADAIVTGTLDMSKFNVSNLSADDIQTGNLDISGGLRVTSGRHQIMSIDPETLNLEFNVNKMTIGGIKLISEEDRPQMEENIATELENKIKPYLHIAYANNAAGTSGFSINDSANKLYIGTYTDFISTDSTDPTKYSWTLVKGEKGDTGAKGDKGNPGENATARNFLLDSKPKSIINSSTYNIANFYMAEKPVVGETYSITIKGELHSQKHYFGVWNSGGMVHFGNLSSVGNGLYTVTAKWRNTNGSNVADDTFISIHTVPSTVTAASKIEWVTMVKGSVPLTEWVPAHEDIYKYVDDIEIGGRNLVRGSNNPLVAHPRNTGGAADNYNFVRIQAPMKKDEVYTLSFNLNITHGNFNQVSVYTQYGHTIIVLVDIVNNRGVHTFKAVEDTDTDNIFIYAGRAGSTRGNGLVLTEYQLEKGNKATDWSPAPEDVQSEIDGKASADDVASALMDLQQELEAAATASELSDFIQEYNKELAARESEKRDSESRLSKAQEAIDIITNDMRDRSESWNFLDRSISNTPEGMVIGNESTGSYLLIKEDRISFFSNGNEVAFISQNLMEISRGAFVEEIQISKYKLEGNTKDSHLTFRYVG